MRYINVMNRALALILVATVLGACSPVYHFEFQPRNDADVATIEDRLLNVLTPSGFKLREEVLAKETRAVGVTDYFRCNNARDLQVLEKEWRSSGQYHWVWVHSFKCNGAPKFVVSSSPNADSEAGKIQKALMAEFREEANSGALRINNRSRLPLE